MSNEITTTENTKVSTQLCIDYIKSQNTQLTDGEFAQYAAVATTLNLNPFLREIYPIKYNGKMTLVTGYQVYIRRAEEFPQYDGFDTDFTGEGKNLCCICSVYRKDRSRPTVARVYLSEYHQGNSMWNSKPHVMLEKVAIGTAFRRAFPSEFNGMPYTTEEIRGEEILQQQGMTEVKAEVPAAPAEAQKPPKGKSSSKPRTDDEKTENFLKMMEALKQKNEAVYNDCFGFYNFKDESSVPAEERVDVYTAISNAIENAENTNEEEA